MPGHRKSWALYLYVVSDSAGGAIDGAARADVTALMKAVRTKAGRSCHVELRADFSKGRSVHATEQRANQPPAPEGGRRHRPGVPSEVLRRGHQGHAGERAARRADVLGP